MNPIQNIEISQTESNNDSGLTVDIQGIEHWGIPNRKTRKQWYQSTNPQIRSYITGNLATNISGKGARSLKRASDEYQYLSEDLARNSYSSKAMSKKYDNFNGIDSSLLDRALENENKQLDTYQQQFNTGQLSERKFNRLQQKHGRRINNLNENYQTLSEVWHNKHDVPLVRTQSSVSPAPFLLGTIGLPAAIIGGISGGIAAAPYLGKALANPWVQRGLTGLDVVDTGVQVASGNYLGAAANWIPYDKAGKLFKNITINGKPLNNAQLEALWSSLKDLKAKGIKKPSQAQIVNNSSIGFTVPEQFYSGAHKTQPEVKSYLGDIWMSNDKDVYTYFSNRNYPGGKNITNKFQAGYPTQSKIHTTDFNNSSFRGELDSDEVLRGAKRNGYDVVVQTNIQELTKPGTNIIIPEGTDRLIISEKEKFKYLDPNWMKFTYFKK